MAGAAFNDFFLTTASSFKYQFNNITRIETGFIADFAISSKKTATCEIEVLGVFPAGFNINGTHILFFTERYFTLVPAYATTGNRQNCDLWKTLSRPTQHVLLEKETRTVKIMFERDKVRLF